MKYLLLHIAGSPDQALQLLDSCTSHQRFCTGSMYDYIRTRREPVPWAKQVHGDGCHPKHSFTAVMALQNGFPTVDKLTSRGLYMVNRCALCEHSCEDIHHLFFDCVFSRQVLMIIAHWVSLPLTTYSLAFILQDGVYSIKHRPSLMATVYYL
ncbi:uncharacterized protein LOC141595332 [Silene latifolia]|uniref:uncharacterized protein LOC141595332 n=1 Tax=Silene latifolia TaxID=37657 RepID=UPI003D76AC65